MKVQVFRGDQEELLDVEFDSPMTSRQMLRLQRELGDERFDEFLRGKVRPDVIHTMVWVKVASLYSDVAVDDIDFDYDDATSEIASAQDPSGEA